MNSEKDHKILQKIKVAIHAATLHD